MCGEGLDIEPGPLYVVAKHSTTELHPQLYEPGFRRWGQNPPSSLSQFLSPELYLGWCSEQGIFSNMEGPGEDITRTKR